MPEGRTMAKNRLRITLLAAAQVAALACPFAPAQSRAEQQGGVMVREERETGWLERVDEWIGDLIDRISLPQGTSGATRGRGRGDRVCLLWPSPFHLKGEGNQARVIESVDRRPTITSTTPMTNIVIRAADPASGRPTVERRGVGLEALGMQVPWPQLDDNKQVYAPLQPHERLTIQALHVVDGERVRLQREVVGSSRERMEQFDGLVVQAGDDPELWKKSIETRMNTSDPAMVMALLMHADRPSHPDLDQARDELVRQLCSGKWESRK